MDSDSGTFDPRAARWARCERSAEKEMAALTKDPKAQRQLLPCSRSFVTEDAAHITGTECEHLRR